VEEQILSLDITLNLQENGVIAHLISTLNMTRKFCEGVCRYQWYNGDFDSRFGGVLDLHC
jgi:hypothetical protein